METIKRRYKRIEESAWNELEEHDKKVKWYLMRQRRATNAKGSNGQMTY